MADNFTVVAQRRTVQPLANGTVQDVVEITARALPSGVVFTRVIPFVRWAEQSVAEALAPIADNIDAIMAHYPIVSAAPYQEIDASGLVANGIEFTVTTEAQRGQPVPTMTTLVRVPMQQLFQGSSFGAFFDGPLGSLEHSAGL
jgi:hypothetical protein